MRPDTTLKISLRLPPTLNPEAAKEHLVKLLTENVPYNAQVKIESITTMPGWSCPPIAPYLTESI